MLCLVFIFFCVVLLAVRLYSIFNSDYWKKRGIVQVDGVLQTFFRKGYSIPEIYKNIYNEHPNEIYTGILFPKPALIIKDVQDIQAVLQGDFQSFHSRGLLTNPRDVLGNNLLFTNEYKRWRLVRQKISPVFTSKKLKNMFYIMNDCATNFFNQLGHFEYNNMKSFDILYAYNTAFINATIFSVDTPPHNIMDSPFIDMAKKVADPTLKTNFKKIFVNTMPKIFNILNLKEFGEHEEFFVGTVKKIIEIRRKDNVPRHDFIDTCIELQNSGTMKDQITSYELEPTAELLAAQAFFFFLAGIDTSTTAMHFTLLELSANPHILRRLAKEIDDIFFKSNNNPTYDDLEEMVYLDMVISEAMRKFPPIGILPRVCTRDTMLPVGQIPIKKDDLVIVPVFALHRNEKYFPDPEIFDPERFNPDNIHNIIKFTYLPFGEGNRTCLGARYARLQMKMGLSWLLRKYSLKHQKYEPTSFDKSLFAIRDSKSQFELIPRNIDSDL